MPAVVADTHAVIWYLTASTRLSETAAQRMRDAIASGDGVYLSAITLVELVYLVEKGRIPASHFQSLLDSIADPQSGLRVVPVDERVAQMVASVARADVPDLPDRIIAATALELRCPLVTRDRAIRAAGIDAIW